MSTRDEMQPGFGKGAMLRDDGTEVNFTGTTKTTTIAGGETTSGSIDCRGQLAIQIHIPSNFDGSNLEIEGSMDDSTFADLYDKDGSQQSWSDVTAGTIRQLDPALWGVPYLRFVADAQGAEDPVTLTISVQ